MKLCQSEFSKIVKKPIEKCELNMRINENQILFKEERTKKSRKDSLKMFFMNIDKVAATMWRENALGIVVFDITSNCFICHVVFAKKLGNRIGHAFKVAFKINQEKVAKAMLLLEDMRDPSKKRSESDLAYWYKPQIPETDLPKVLIETPESIIVEPPSYYSYLSPVKIETPEPVLVLRSSEKPKLPTPEPARSGTPLEVKMEREVQKNFQVGFLGIVCYLLESGFLSKSSKSSEVNMRMEHEIASDSEFRDLSSKDLSVALKPWSKKNRDETTIQVKVNQIKNPWNQNRNNVYMVMDVPEENIGNVLKGNIPIDLVFDSMTYRINLREN
ncbi:unnamed protein product [Gordionus sp. m RMFG-2023]